jgi:8-oxo-dGTP pyrophosphatase MutT (NUDIX family)
MNALREFLEEVGHDLASIEAVHILREEDYEPKTILEKRAPITIDDLKVLDFEYDAGFGGRVLYGTIWRTDGTWHERDEYDGSEWWRHVTRPEIDF